MRTFEIILLVLIIISFLFITFNIRKKYRKEYLLLVTIVSLLHLFFEGYRWQMVPIYLSNIILLICIYKNYKLLKGTVFFKILTSLFLIFILFINYLTPTLLPIFELPNPTGKYQIGADYFYLKTNRLEEITENPKDLRELMIKVWYPATIKNEEKEQYLNDGDRISFAAKYGLPKSIFNYLNYVETNTFQKPNVAKGKFPVLIFSHGSYSKASGYYAIIESVVSRGYIVFNINHTYESTGTKFPDGTIRLYNQNYDKKYISNQETATLAWKMQQDYQNSNTELEKLKASEFALKNYIAGNISRRWSKDISSVIDELKNWNANSFLASHIDVSKIGVYGHSQGGSAVGQSLLDDERITAGINLDGVQWGTMIDTQLPKPFLFISSDWENSHPNYNKFAYRNGSKVAFYNAKIKESGHSNFMDIPLIINSPQINEAGTIDVNLFYKIINSTVISFFDQYLKEKENDILELNEFYPSLDIKKK